MITLLSFMMLAGVMLALLGADAWVLLSPRKAERYWRYAEGLWIVAGLIAYGVLVLS